MQPSGADPLRDEILRLELALARRDPRGIPGGLGGLLADDFTEFGASGRTWSAAVMRELLAGEPSRDLGIEAFEITVLAPGVALATYRTGPPRPSNRASIWVERAGRWQLRFHQGTLLQPAAS